MSERHVRGANVKEALEERPRSVGGALRWRRKRSVAGTSERRGGGERNVEEASERRWRSV